MIDEPLKAVVSMETRASSAEEKANLKENLSLIFIGRFWFSNMAWFNEMKRYLKLQMRDVNSHYVDMQLADLAYNLTLITAGGHGHLVNAGNFDLDNTVANMIEQIEHNVWYEYGYQSQGLLNDATYQIISWAHNDVQLYQVTQELQEIK